MQAIPPLRKDLYCGFLALEQGIFEKAIEHLIKCADASNSFVQLVGSTHLARAYFESGQIEQCVRLIAGKCVANTSWYRAFRIEQVLEKAMDELEACELITTLEPPHAGREFSTALRTAESGPDPHMVDAGVAHADGDDSDDHREAFCAQHGGRLSILRTHPSEVHFLKGRK